MSNISDDEGSMDSIEKSYTPQTKVFNSLKCFRESNDNTPLMAFNVQRKFSLESKDLNNFKSAIEWRNFDRQKQVPSAESHESGE